MVGAHRLEGRHDVLQAAEREQALAGREELPERGVLRDDRAARGQVAGAPIAEPAASQADVLVLGHGELATGAQDVVAVGLDLARERHRVDDAPAVLPQQPDRVGVLGVPGHPRGAVGAGLAAHRQG